MMNTSRLFIRRMAPTVLKHQQQQPMAISRPAVAAFSTECAPAEKLRTVLEEYRRTNFSDEIPSRFRKHIIKAVQEPEDNQTFQVDTLNRILENIGREDARLSSEELNVLLHEAGSHGNDRHMPISKMMQLM